jgi:hypothetical protein
MNRRLQLWLGVSACALLGALTLPTPVLAGSAGGNGQGNAQDKGLDPNGGFQHECGEPGGCAEAGETIETRRPEEFLNQPTGRPLVVPTQPRSDGGGLSGSDSVKGVISGGSLGGNGGLGH